MRRIALFCLALALSGCGYKTWWNPPFSGGSNPNEPVGDSENLLRVRGQEPPVKAFNHRTGRYLARPSPAGSNDEGSGRHGRPDTRAGTAGAGFAAQPWHSPAITIAESEHRQFHASGKQSTWPAAAAVGAPPVQLRRPACRTPGTRVDRPGHSNARRPQCHHRRRPWLPDHDHPGRGPSDRRAEWQRHEHRDPLRRDNRDDTDAEVIPI